MTTEQPEALAQECADYATSLRSAANVAKLEGRAPPVSFLRAADLFERAASRITELEAQLEAVGAGGVSLYGGDSYGDGNVYRGARSADSAVKTTYTIHELAHAKGVPSIVTNAMLAMGEKLAEAPTPAAQAADSVQEDAARLDFLIDQRAYVVSDPDACPGHWLHWARPDGSTWVQCDEHPTPRAAIDAAIKQGATT
jgi:hypothetical protein